MIFSPFLNIPRIISSIAVNSTHLMPLNFFRTSLGKAFYSVICFLQDLSLSPLALNRFLMGPIKIQLRDCVRICIRFFFTTLMATQDYIYQNNISIKRISYFSYVIVNKYFITFTRQIIENFNGFHNLIIRHF